MPANVRRWAAAQLGLGPPARKGSRPRVNLRPVAGVLRHAAVRSGFEQRLVYERLMAEHVELRARRDLDAPAYLSLDPAARFPRAVVSARGGGADPASLFGPFRHRRAAAAARDALHRRFPLRPCDYAFEPDPQLPLGLGCVYAQVRSCAAPCLARVSEEGYRGIAAEAAAFLAAPSPRTPEHATWLPPWVSRSDARALVVEALPAAPALAVGTGSARPSSDQALGSAPLSTRKAVRVQLFPVLGGAVLDAESCVATEGELEQALARVRWAPPEPPRDDTPWLVAWLRAPRRRGRYLVLADGISGSSSALSNAARSALAPAARGSEAAS